MTVEKIKQECSFCGAGLKDVEKLVSGQVHESKQIKYICDKCIVDCEKILANEKLCVNKVIRFN